MLEKANVCNQQQREMIILKEIRYELILAIGKGVDTDKAIINVFKQQIDKKISHSQLYWISVALKECGIIIVDFVK